MENQVQANQPRPGILVYQDISEDKPQNLVVILHKCDHYRGGEGMLIFPRLFQNMGFLW